MANILAVIPARGGSKGIPQKNIKDLAGKPMIAWSINAAKKIQGLKLIVSTDDEKIAAIARQHGADVPFIRPADLSTDTAGSFDVVLHALEWMKAKGSFHPDFILLLQPTSPLRSLDDILAAINMQSQKDADAIVSVCPISHPVSWFVDLSADGKVLPTPDLQIALRRQDAGSYYELNGALYLVRAPAFYKERTFIPKNTFAYVMPPDRSIDIDTPWDFYLADLILRDKYAEATHN
jgi:CMP-N,N'-diacetyllegionaminic acid synthase